jgi:predicted DNA-binding WGR domain protein
MAFERKLQLSDGKSNKFWTIRVDGDKYAVTFGRIGTAGQTREKEFASAELCAKAADKTIAEKLGEGYVDVAPASGAAETATAPVAKPAQAKPAQAKPAKPKSRAAADSAEEPWLAERNPSERFRRFAAGEYLDYRQLFYYGLPMWDFDSRFHADFDLDLNPFYWNNLSPADYPGYVPICPVRPEGDKEARTDFLAVDASAAECPVYVWDHEHPSFTLIAPSLDAFLGSLLKKSAKTPLKHFQERVIAANKRAAAFNQKKDYAATVQELAGLLTMKIESFKDKWDLRREVGTGYALLGTAWEGLGEIEKAVAALRRSEDDDAQKQLAGILFHELHDYDGVIALARDQSWVRDYDWLALFVEANLAKGDAAAAAEGLREVCAWRGATHPDEIIENRVWLERLAARYPAATEFLTWFKPTSAEHWSPEQRAQSRAWWESLPRYGDFWQEALAATLDLDTSRPPSDDELARLEAIRELELDQDYEVTDVTPLARLTLLEELKLYGSVETLEPLRPLAHLEKVEVNGNEVKFLRLPRRCDRELRMAAQDQDEARLLDALAAGADPNTKDESIQSPLHFLLARAPKAPDKALKLAKLLIERGADPYAHDGQGITALEACDEKLRKELGPWLEARGQRPPVPGFYTWREQLSVDDADFLELRDGAGEKVYKLPLSPTGAYTATMSSGGGKTLHPFHTIYLKPFCLVAEPLMRFLRDHAPLVEFFPVEVRLPSKKPAGKGYFVMTVPLLDCLDEQACDAIYRTGHIQEVRRLVIDESRLPAEMQLFRVKPFPRDLLVRAALADRLRAADFDAFALQPARR